MTIVNPDAPCEVHNSDGSCLLCHPPHNVWVDHGGGDWHRVDADGTTWTVCPDRPAPDGGSVYTLCMRFRDHRLVSEHPSKDAAMQHRDDMVRAFAARTLKSYAGGA